MGANSEEDSGLYFSWGNTNGHVEGSYNFSEANYNASPGAAITDNLSLSQDAARANLGAPWRMPTKEDFKELFDNCTSLWTTRNGVNGRLFISNVNGNSIFLPAAGNYDGTTLLARGSRGYYWSSSYYSEINAYDLNFDSANVRPQNYFELRRSGFTCRAVLDL